MGLKQIKESEPRVDDLLCVSTSVIYKQRVAVSNEPLTNEVRKLASEHQKWSTEIRRVKLTEEGIWKELNVKVDAIAESVKKPVGFNELLANFGVKFPEDPFWWWISFLVFVVPTGAFFVFPTGLFLSSALSRLLMILSLSLTRDLVQLTRT